METTATNWDEWTAIGTLALAVVTVLAVAVTIWATLTERGRTDQRLLDERRHTSAVAERDRTIDLLLRLAEAVAIMYGHQGDPGRKARFDAHALLAALPLDVAVLVRVRENIYGVGYDEFNVAPQTQTKIDTLRSRFADISAVPNPEQQLSDIGMDIAALRARR